MGKVKMLIVIFFLSIISLQDVNAVMKDRNFLNNDYYGFHPHAFRKFSMDRLNLSFDVSKEVKLMRLDVDLKADFELEEHSSEQETKTSLEAHAHTSFVDIGLKTEIHTGFFYRNGLETELSLNKTIKIFNNLKLSPEVHVINFEGEYEADFSIKILKEI